MARRDRQQEQDLLARIWSFKYQPYEFALYAYPWGQSGTPLAGFKGLRSWQADELIARGEHDLANRVRVAEGKTPKVYRSATSSGRGPGKSCLTAIMGMHMISCHVGSSTIVTANTEPQLKSRTMAELGKWHTLAINAHWFDRKALSLSPAKWYAETVQRQLQIDPAYYYLQAQLWSEENPDAFAGVHNPYGLLLIFDESSGIPEPIWTVSEGFFTEPVIPRYWYAFSNPRRNTGAFFECFHRDRNRWSNRYIDSRTVEGVDVDYLNGIVERYGEDHDIVRVEVLGRFPKQGVRQFISREIVDGALDRQTVEDTWAPLIAGGDVARFGDDSSVLRFRQGRDGRVIPPVVSKKVDNMELANEWAHWIDKTDPDAVCIDAGNGTGVIDRLRELGFKVHEVWFGSKSSSPEWYDKRTEIWAEMREWLRGGCIDDLQELKDDLVGPDYEFRGDKIKLESKEKMKERGLASPDHGDALACTFAVKVARRDRNVSRKAWGGRQNSSRRVAKNVDYQVFS